MQVNTYHTNKPTHTTQTQLHTRRQLEKLQKRRYTGLHDNLIQTNISTAILFRNLACEKWGQIYLAFANPYELNLIVCE